MGSWFFLFFNFLFFAVDECHGYKAFSLFFTGSLALLPLRMSDFLLFSRAL